MSLYLSSVMGVVAYYSGAPLAGWLVSGSVRTAVTVAVVVATSLLWLPAS